MRRFRDLIVGVIREERVLCVLASCGQALVAGNKHPVVGVAYNAHKKGGYGIDVGDFKPGFAVDLFSG
jgi:hypothetical protein